MPALPPRINSMLDCLFCAANSGEIRSHFDLGFLPLDSVLVIHLRSFLSADLSVNVVNCCRYTA